MEKVLDHEGSLAVIHEMIQKTRRNITEGSFYYLVWGWLTLAAASTQYILLTVANSEWHAIVWPVMGVVGGIASAIYGRKSSARKGHTTFVDKSMGYVWIAFGAMMALALIIGGTQSWRVGYSIIIALYGMGTFVSGGLLRFKPLIYGGVASWVISAFALLAEEWTQEFPNMIVLLVVSIIVSYLIPGYALKSAEKKNNAA
ncbi:MAG: hypothetical protein EP346_03700 [Bacteroidetes bacterium]|nr:MAG: hypothetical protein EP346_03700 [Bacteroidota bacterium]